MSAATIERHVADVGGAWWLRLEGVAVLGKAGERRVTTGGSADAPEQLLYAVERGDSWLEADFHGLVEYAAPVSQPGQLGIDQRLNALMDDEAAMAPGPRRLGCVINSEPLIPGDPSAEVQGARDHRLRRRRVPERHVVVHRAIVSRVAAALGLPGVSVGEHEDAPKPPAASLSLVTDALSTSSALAGGQGGQRAVAPLAETPLAETEAPVRAEDDVASVADSRGDKRVQNLTKLVTALSYLLAAKKPNAYSRGERPNVTAIARDLPGALPQHLTISSLSRATLRQRIAEGEALLRDCLDATTDPCP